jgi:hypothetical protein
MLLSVAGADPGFQVMGWAHLKKLRRAEGGAKVFGVFRVKNHEFTPKNHIFSNFRGGGGAPPPPLDPPLGCRVICLPDCTKVCPGGIGEKCSERCRQKCRKVGIHMYVHQIRKSKLTV